MLVATPQLSADKNNTVFWPEISGFFLHVGFVKNNIRNFRYHTGSLTNILILIH